MAYKTTSWCRYNQHLAALAIAIRRKDEASFFGLEPRMQDLASPDPILGPVPLNLLQLICSLNKSWLDSVYNKLIKPQFDAIQSTKKCNIYPQMLGYTHFEWVVVCNQLSLLENLLNNPNKKTGFSAAIKHNKSSLLLIAADYGHTEIVALLLKAGASVDAIDKNKKTPLYLAAQNGHAKVVVQLLRAGATINSSDAPPLLVAARRGHTAIVVQLLIAGAAVNPWNISRSHTSTPLQAAARRGHTAIIVQLLTAGAAVNSRHIRKHTPLKLAAKNGHNEAVAVLLAAGAAVNSRHIQSSPPLHLAAKNNHPNVVSQLLKAGANIKQRRQGKTALDIAREHGHSTVVELLEAHMADNEVRHHITP
jgi:ankyrin repeat protein